MRRTANLKLATTMLVAFCLVITQLEVGAFAQSTQSNPPIAATESQAADPPQVALESNQGQKKPQSGRRRLKWLLVGVAVVGGIAAAVLLTKKKAEPVVTVGGPTVGNPQ
jgi:hypothetical protein